MPGTVIRHLIVITAAALLLHQAAPVAHGAEELLNRANFGASLAWNRSTPDGGSAEANSVSGRIHLGYFFLEWLEGGASLELTGIESEHQKRRLEDTFVHGLGYMKAYLLGKWNLMPFVGAQTGFSRGDFDDGTQSWENSSFAWGGMGGMSAFFSENACMSVEYNYLRTNYDVWAGGPSDDFEHHRLYVGFSYFFSGTGL
ncbi:MAG: outer membrane beta-barrel protein [Desulfatibacillaceae bacterium]